MDEFRDDQITIGFYYENAYGSEYSSRSTINVYFDEGENELSCIGEQFNAFLKMAGYVMPNDYILMESLTDDEYDELVAHLDEYRSSKEND